MQIDSPAIMLSQDGSMHSWGWAVGAGPVATQRSFHYASCSPMGVPVAAPRVPEAGHQGGTPGLGAVL